MIERRQEGTVAVVELRHGSANALDVELLGALVAAVDEVEQGPASALVLTGSGSIFSAGVDLFRLLQGGAGYLESFLPALDAALLRLFSCDKPAVAAVNGHALAGGWILAQACDYRVMTTAKAKGGLPELLVGVPFPPSAIEVVRFATPAPHLQEMVLTGRTYGGEEAAQRGLVEEAAAPEQVLPRAVAVAERLGKVPAEAWRLTKRQLRAPTLERIRANEPVTQEVRAAWARPATTAAIRAYLDRVVGKG